MANTEKISEAIAAYCNRCDLKIWQPLAALIDMDGVLYDSMPRHAAAWQRMMHEVGIETTVDEFFLYEGMTGAATINLLFERHLGRSASSDEVKKLYAMKSEYFKSFGERILMPGADMMLRALMELGIRRVLVTGSAQGSLLDAIKHDYPGAFAPGDRVTALDVTKGKPEPEPYLKGIEKAGVTSRQAIVIENAPLGVQAGHAAGCFTVGITTGPIPAETMHEAGADIVFNSMPEFAESVRELVTYRK